MCVCVSEREREADIEIGHVYKYTHMHTRAHTHTKKYQKKNTDSMLRRLMRNTWYLQIPHCLSSQTRHPVLAVAALDKSLSMV